jgi:hypothetical protein
MSSLTKSARVTRWLDLVPALLLIPAPWLVVLYIYGSYYLTGTWPTPFR